MYSCLLLGLDNSGKSCFVHNVKTNIFDVEKYIMPTAGFELHTINVPYPINSLLFYDCSGQGRHRKMWNMFYHEVDAIVYVIDSTDIARLSIVKDTIEIVLSDKTVQTRGLPVLFLINKIDSELAIERENIREVLKLDHMKSLVKKYAVKEVSSFTGSGVSESIEWITNAIISSNGGIIRK